MIPRLNLISRRHRLFRLSWLFVFFAAGLLLGKFSGSGGLAPSARQAAVADFSLDAFSRTDTEWFIGSSTGLGGEFAAGISLWTSTEDELMRPLQPAISQKIHFLNTSSLENLFVYFPVSTAALLEQATGRIDN